MVKRMILYSVIITMVLFTLQGVGLPQDKQQKDDFQKKVDDAIDRGAEFLSKNGLRKQGGQQRNDILALYALVHADREKDKKLLGSGEYTEPGKDNQYSKNEQLPEEYPGEKDA